MSTTESRTVDLRMVDQVEVTYSPSPSPSPSPSSTGPPPSGFSFVRCLRSSCRFLFSQVGLCALVLVYTVVGGFVFQHLEQENEIHECRTKMTRYAEVEEETIGNLLVIVSSFNAETETAGEEEEKAAGEFRNQLQSFGRYVSQQGVEVGGEDLCENKPKDGDWTFASSMLFSITVITTIGYGNVAPKTVWGRLVCMCYAMLGIPLMLLCLANIANVLGDAFRYVYSQMLCCGCCKRRSPHHRKASDKKKVEKEEDEKKKKMQAEESELLMQDLRDASLGRRRQSEGNPTDEQQNAAGQTKEQSETKKKKKKKKEIQRVKDDTNNETMMTMTKRQNDDDDKGDDDDDEEEEEEEEEEEVGVPLTVSLGLIAAYLLFGSALFSALESESEWTAMDSAYYCFVTISTIGFGDLVPGATAAFDSSDDAWRMVGASLYMLVGMALLSMCFNLIQEGVEAKFKRVGQMMGLGGDE